MPNSRRRFVLQGGRAALLLTLPLGLGSCKRPEGRGQGTDDASSETVQNILGRDAVEMLMLASRAPSGHNTQPWKVRIIDRAHWVLGIAESRRLPAVDGTGRETLLSLGAFVENLSVAAAHHGLAVEYEVVARSAAEPQVLDLRLRPSGAGGQVIAGEALDAMRLRRTVRGGFLPEAIRAEDMAAIVSGGGAFHSFARGSAGAKYLSEGTVAANRHQAYRDAAESELAEWIRWRNADAERYGNGLTPASMEIGGVAGWYVSHFYDRASVMSKSFRETTVKQVVERVGEGGGWLVLTSEGTSVATLIETGRQLERMWLKLRERRIAIHPMTQMLEESPWRDTVAAGLRVSGVPQFLLRIGYVRAYPEPASLRMPIGRFVQVQADERASPLDE